MVFYIILQGAVTVLLSGNRVSPSQLSSESPRYVTLDGRIPENLDDNWEFPVVGWLSQNWNTLFPSLEVPFSEETCSQIQQYREKTHAKGQRIRFWSIPQREPFWNELIRCGVDLINSDEYVLTKDFLLS